jgi:GxxExxY protein
MDQDPLPREIIGAAIEAHRALGPGLLESIDELRLCDEIGRRRQCFERRVALPVEYKGRRVEGGLRMDLVVAQRVIVEIKSADVIHPIHEAQLLTYMRLARLPVGLLINLNVPVLKNGVKRRSLSEFLTHSELSATSAPLQ